MRLVQFTWIDALLNGFAGRPPPLNPPARETAVVHVGSLPLKEPGAGLMESKELQERLQALRRQILPAHVRYAWRYRSFGSSANNHILGELTGLILAIARWPELAHWAGSLAVLRKLWERGLVEKEYLAIVHGHVREEKGLIDAPLGRDEQSQIAIKDKVRPDGAAAWPSVEIHVGRTCPPRVQASLCGAPERASARDRYF